VELKQSIQLNFPYSNTIKTPNILEKISATPVTIPVTDLHNQEDTGMIVRTCHTCHQELPLSSFVVQTASKLGHTFECKECHRHADNILYNPQRMKFHGIQVRVKTLRTNVCQICGATISENGGRQMSRHHYRVDTYDPLKYTVELCMSCHAKIPREVKHHV
jgi:hypothetical protein